MAQRIISNNSDKAEGDRLWHEVEAAQAALHSDVGGEQRLVAAWNAYADWTDLPQISE
jgi:hypothetical protein